MFIDDVVVEVTGGKGGNGMASFRREKYVEYGGPWGGNGGNGGSVVFVGDEGMHTLSKLHYNRHIKAANGVSGKSKGMHGANAENTYVRVPLGTIVYTEDKSRLIGEVTHHDEEIIIAKGGKGGRGNMAFATHKNPAPKFAENGDKGEQFRIRVELKVLADVGLIGYPSVGKSTLISVVSNARPKVAAYPFTTLTPHLGMVDIDDQSFVLADLPGLVEDAHQGHGLGIRFLKHIERCRVFVHIVDLTHDDPFLDYQKIRHELEMYDEKLLSRPEIIVANKIDMPDSEEKLASLKKKIPTIIGISALNKSNVQTLLYAIKEQLKEAPIIEEEQIEKVYKFEETPAFVLSKDEDTFILEGEKLRTIFDRVNFTNEDAVKRFARQLRSLGVDQALREAGAVNGDRVKIFDFEFEFIE